METHELHRKKVFGGIQRLLHAGIGILVLFLVALGWVDKMVEPGTWEPLLIALHIKLGYGLVLVLILRIIWGLVGPEEARFTKFLSRRNARWGHEPLASISYLIFYAGLVISCASGFMLAAIEYDIGILADRFFDDFTFHEWITLGHDGLFFALNGFIALHIGALIFHEKERGYPLAQAMLSGYQYRPSTPEITIHEENSASRSDSGN